MKIFKQINDITMKVAKGMVAIFAIKLVLLLGVFIFNSCQTEGYEITENNQAKNDFLASLSRSNEAINNIEIANSYILSKPNSTSFAKSSDENSGDPLIQQHTQTVCFTFNPTNEIDLDSVEEDTETLGETLGLGGDLTSIDGININIEDDSTNDNGSDDTDDNTEELEQFCFEIPIQPTQEELDPTIQAAKNYLYNKGFNNQEIDDFVTNEWNGSEEHLVPFVMYVAQVSEDDSTASSIDFKNLLFTSMYAQSTVPELTADEVWDCAVDAVGLGFVSAVAMHGAKKAGIKLLTKAFTKFVSKFAGPIGVAIMVADFGFCLYGQAND